MIELRTTEYRPNTVSAPGETLLDLLDERGLSQAELARRLDRPIKTVNEIVKGKAAIVPETALQLEQALGVPAEFWLTREARYREWIARREADEELRQQVPWLRDLPLKEMRAFNWIASGTTRAETVRACLSFFGVASVEAWRATYERPLAAFRASSKVKKQPGAVAAWLRQGEREAAGINCEPFDADKFREALGAIRALTCEPDPGKFVPGLRDLCKECGVAVVFVPAPKGCPASGATKWLSAEKALILLSLPYKTNDQLWFTFFHEAAHILLHGKSLVFVEDFGAVGGDDEKEREANQFARDFLIPKGLSERLVDLRITHDAVRDFAKDAGIAPGIVVGRLQREKLAPWTHLNDLKVRFRARARGPGPARRGRSPAGRMPRAGPAA